MIWPVWMSDAEFPSGTTHQGACGPCEMVGSAKATPPPSDSTDDSQSQAPATSEESQASHSFSMCRAISTAAGWLASHRQSGSSA